jgi:hypothetical protein
MWKEVTMAYWRYFPSIFQKVLRKITKKFVMIVGVPAWIQTCYYPNASREALLLVSSSVLGADIIIHLRSPYRQSRSSTFDVMNTLRTAKSRDRGSISSRGKRLLSCSKHADRFWIHPKIFSYGLGGWSVKLTNHMHLVSKFKMSGAALPLPARLHGVL